MKRVEEQYKTKGLKVIWMGFQDKKDKIMEFMLKHNINSSVGYDKRNLISQKYGIKYGAGVVMINRDGIVKKRVPKGFSEKVFLEALGNVIQETGSRAEKR